MNKKIRILVADKYDPWFNLATEDWIFRDVDTDCHILFLWRNADTVVIGRFQNPWNECNTKKMEADGIKLARRQSGGGAVFHDLGNTNFTFMSPKAEYDKTANNKIITNALAKMNIEAFASGRNDIIVKVDEDERKISGSAFKETKDRCFHHGTLLINADLTKLSQYLNPDKKKLEAKGIKSVRARVINLQELNPEINHETLTKHIIDEFKSFYGAEAEIETLNYESLKELPKIQTYYEKMKDWNWTHGETPKFEHFFETRLSLGSLEVHLNSNKAKITKIKIFSDSIYPTLIEEIMQKLEGINYDIPSVKNALNELNSNFLDLKNEINEFSDWFCENLA